MVQLILHQFPPPTTQLSSPNRKDNTHVELA